MSYETWSWWSPSNNFDTNEKFEDDQKEVENENSKIDAVNKYEEMTISTTEKVKFYAFIYTYLFSHLTCCNFSFIVRT